MSKKKRVQAAARAQSPARPQAPSRPQASERAQLPAARASDSWVAYATVPLRFFLGATFLYAGLQKIADPGFLRAGSSTYIGTQLQSFAAHSPIGAVVDALAVPTPQLTGIGVIATELVVGALVIAGVATRWAAVVGALVNFVFFLTASWTIQPYFLGSDSIYTVAWVTLALVGDQGVLTARPLIFGSESASRARRTTIDPQRRRLMLQLGGAAVAMVWVLSVLPRARLTPVSSLPTPSPAETPTPSPTATPTGSPAASPSAAPTAAGTRIGTKADLLAQSFLDFADPKTGDPGIAVSLSGQRVVAFSAICTHAGCQVGYDSGQRLLVCPCHGAVFDPAHNAAVLQGPAPTPLPSIPIHVASDGGLYVT